MEKLLTTVLNTYQSLGYVPVELVNKAKKYDRRHPMWSCMATDEMREAWAIVQNDDFHI